MLGFIGDKLNIPEAGIISQEIQQILENRGAKTETIKSLLANLKICDMMRFSIQDTNQKEMETFLEKSEAILTQLSKELLH